MKTKSFESVTLTFVHEGGLFDIFSNSINSCGHRICCSMSSHTRGRRFFYQTHDAKKPYYYASVSSYSQPNHRQRPSFFVLQCSLGEATSTISIHGGTSVSEAKIIADFTLSADGRLRFELLTIKIRGLPHKNIPYFPGYRSNC